MIFPDVNANGGRASCDASEKGESQVGGAWLSRERNMRCGVHEPKTRYRRSVKKEIRETMYFETS